MCYDSSAKNTPVCYDLSMVPSDSDFEDEEADVEDEEEEEEDAEDDFFPGAPKFFLVSQKVIVNTDESVSNQLCEAVPHCKMFP